MNTEIFDYLKALSQKDDFLINATNTVLSVVILIAGFFSVRDGASMLMYTIMFAAATGILMLNGYKSFKKKRKNAIVFFLMGILFAAITAIGVYALIGGAA